MGQMDVKTNVYYNHFGPHLCTLKNVKPKWIKDLNARVDTIKLFKENTGRTLFGHKAQQGLFQSTLE